MTTKHMQNGRKVIEALYHASETVGVRQLTTFVLYMAPLIHKMRQEGISLEEIQKVLDESDEADRLGVM